MLADNRRSQIRCFLRTTGIANNGAVSWNQRWTQLGRCFLRSVEQLAVRKLDGCRTSVENGQGARGLPRSARSPWNLTGTFLGFESISLSKASLGNLDSHRPEH